MVVKMRWDIPAAMIALAFLPLAVSCGKGRERSQSTGDVSTTITHPLSQSAVSEATRAQPESCSAAEGVFCFIDTAHVRSTRDDPVDSPRTDWIWFGAAQDSIEILGPAHSYVATNFGQEHDARNNTANYFHHRLTTDGLITIWFSLDEVEGDSVPYRLTVRLQRSASSRAPQPTGQTAMINVVSANASDQFSLIPLSIAPSVNDRKPWIEFAHPYKVALVQDSLYEFCRVPCRAPDTLKLKPSTSVTKKF